MLEGPGREPWKDDSSVGEGLWDMTRLGTRVSGIKKG